MFGLDQKVIEKIINIVKEYPEITQVKVFGSRALGNYKNESDIDLVLYGNISDNTFKKIITELDEISAPYFFDVIVYDTIEHADLKRHIDEYAKVLY